MKFRTRRDLPASGDFAQLQAALSFFVIGSQFRNRLFDCAPINFDYASYHFRANRLVRDKDEGLSDRLQLGIANLPAALDFRLWRKLRSIYFPSIWLQMHAKVRRLW